MPRYEFSLSAQDDTLRLAGTVTSPSFERAIEAIAERASVEDGDRLEIGVTGFPPARFESVVSVSDGSVGWLPQGRLAA